MRIAIVLVLIVLAIGAWVAYAWEYGGVPVQVVSVHQGSIQESIDERGKTRLPRTYTITMPYTGRITEISWQEGTKIDQGELVAQIVDQDLETKLLEAEAAVARLEASIAENEDKALELSVLQQSNEYVKSMLQTVAAAAEQVKAEEAKRRFADKDFKRIRSLFEKGVETEEQYNDAELSIIQAVIDLETTQLMHRALIAVQAATDLLPQVVNQYIARKSLRTAVLKQEKAEAAARLVQAKTDVQRGTMKSPISGMILQRFHIDEALLQGGTELVEIGNLENLEVEADILSQDVVRINPGHPVEIYGPTIGSQPVAGKVQRIYPTGFTKVSSLGVEQQRVKVIIEFSDSKTLQRLLAERKIGVEYRVRVRIFTEQKASALLVPRSAVSRNADGNWQLFVIEDRTVKLQTVQIGLINDEWVEIVQGVSENDTVVLAPENTIQAGIRVLPELVKPPTIKMEQPID